MFKRGNWPLCSLAAATAAWRMSESLHVLPPSNRPSFNIPNHRALPRQRYIRSLFLGQTDKTDSEISPIPSLNLIGGGGKKCEIWPRFSTTVAFDALWFRNGATYRKSIQGERQWSLFAFTQTFQQQQVVGHLVYSCQLSVIAVTCQHWNR